MPFKQSLKNYYQDPFGFVDNLRLVVWGNNLNIFQKAGRVRKTALYFSLSMLAAWVIFGFDSTPLQFIHVLYEGVPPFLMGEAGINDLILIYQTYYGKEMHYSAFVIYGLCFWTLSRHYHKNGIFDSRNIAYSVSLTLLSVAVFEYFWIYSYGVCQRQPWVYTWRWPQLKIMMQNLAFLSVGILGLLQMFIDGHLFNKNNQVIGRAWRLNVDKKLLLLIVLSVSTAWLWLYYPWTVKPLKVQMENGEFWVNSRNFPQTLYTIDLNTTDNVNAGVWFYVENDFLHGWNTLVKVLFTVSFLYVGLVKRVKPCEKP